MTGRPDTRLILAPRLPRLQFFTIAPLAGLVCLVPQVTLIGWIPAAIRSVHVLRP
ncbi:MAG: YqaE/Pmp3 family membrane protein [Komagataeibacter rhaeticus]